MRLAAEVDSGCSAALFKGEELAPLGFEPLAEGDPLLKTFTTAIGDEIYATPFDVTLALPDGTAFDLTVYGAREGTLCRNLLGLELFKRAVVAIDHNVEMIYLTSWASNQPKEIISEFS